MTSRKLARKTSPAAPHLRLVPPRKRAKRRWKIPRSLRAMRKPSYGANPELLRYEEEIVLAVIAELGGATLRDIRRAHPGRFRRKYLWRTIQRLREQGKLLGWRSYSASGGKPRDDAPYEEKKR